ncbi:MAG: hypothetical protein SCK29_00945 [Bacillota bacterium]|nr:hypothetical protein [Bacillota bacterium]MDW7682667.1 hypothetical protein [Bacillota bacterium]
MGKEQLYKRVHCCAEELLAEKGYIIPVELLVRMDRLKAKRVEDWRFRRIPYLERVTGGSLGKMNTILQALREFARASGLKPSRTVYMSWGKGPKVRLRFSKSGTAYMEELYSTHFIQPKD